MKCEKCGYEAPERAVICPECGEILPRETVRSEEKAEKTEQSQATPSDSFAMPFLSAPVASAETEATTDPRSLTAQKQIRQAKKKRWIVISSVAVVLAALIVLYTVFLGGYKLAAFRYIKGVDYASGSMYVALTPDAFMDYLETTYDMTRRDVKESVSDYFVSWNENYGSGSHMSYEITYVKTLDDAEIAELEDELLEDYGITVEIKKAVTANFRIDESGDKSSERSTFIKIGSKWCSIEAMETIDYVCEYDGYGQW